MTKSVLICVIVGVAAYLAGFIPMSVRAGHLQAELREASADAGGAELRDLAALAYIEAVQKNYGLAMRTASQYFDRIPDVAAATRDPERRLRIQQLGQARDTVIAGLAKAEPGVLSRLEDLYIKTRAATLD